MGVTVEGRAHWGALLKTGNQKGVGGGCGHGDKIEAAGLLHQVNELGLISWYIL